MTYMQRDLAAAIQRGISTFAILAVGFIGLHAAQAQTSLSIQHTVLGLGGYTPGQTLDIQVTITKTGTGTITALGVEEYPPDGWTFDSYVSGPAPSVLPTAGDSVLFEFTWITVPALPMTFTYRVNVPADNQGPKTLDGTVLYRVQGVSGGKFSDISTPIPQRCLLTTDVSPVRRRNCRSCDFSRK